MAGIIDHTAKRIKLNEKSRKLPFMATVLLPENPVPMPFPFNGHGVGIATQVYRKELTTDVNGDFRFISTVLTLSMYREVNPTTGVHTATAAPDQNEIHVSRERLRVLHHSCKFTYYSAADNSAGIAAVCAETEDPSFSTWNESAAVLGGRVGAVTLPLADGFYVWGGLASSWTNLTQPSPFYTNLTTNAGYPYIKVSISKATPLTNIGHIEITSIYELTSNTERRSQIFERRFYSRPASQLFEVIDMINRLSIPHVFNGKTYRRDIEEILDEVDRECKRGQIEALRAVPKDELQTKLFQLLVHAVV